VDRQQSKEAESVALSLLRVGAIGSPSWKYEGLIL
jgi:hypothetical protein